MRRADLTGTMASVVDVLAFICALVFLFVSCAVVLWWAYDVSAFIAGGAYERRYELSFVAQFSAILSALIAIVWLRRRTRLAGVRPLQVAWTVCWQTAVVLLFYTIVILLRRYSWTPGQSVDDWTTFFGSVNARFFSEAGALSFVLAALPCISGLSAALFLLQARFPKAKATPQS